ncbi:MAG: transcriptional regulator, Crp/Fnr family [Streptosporangiaceae bacterium]|nr:transcriptional regulator, Crp/Fnr family [Streptosporangiaceae bacterium]
MEPTDPRTPVVRTGPHGNGSSVLEGTAHQPFIRRRFWNDLTEAERSTLRAYGRPRAYAPKMALCSQGDGSDHVVIIMTGWVKVTSSTTEGHDVFLAVRGPSDLVCEGAMFRERNRSATVTSLGPLNALVVPSGRFTTFLDGNPRVSRMVTGTVVNRLDDADRRAQAHATGGGALRIADLLIYLAELSEHYEHYDPPGADGGILIRPQLSQAELGSWVDASRETAARAFKDLRDLGLVRTGRRRITVVDLPGLQAHADRLRAERGAEPGDDGGGPPTGHRR